MALVVDQTVIVLTQLVVMQRRVIPAPQRDDPGTWVTAVV